MGKKIFKKILVIGGVIVLATSLVAGTAFGVIAPGGSFNTTIVQPLTLVGSAFGGSYTITQADYTANQAQFSQGSATAYGTAYDLKYNSPCPVRYGTPLTPGYASTAASRTLKDGFYVKATGPGSVGWVDIPKSSSSVNTLAHSTLVSAYSFHYRLKLNEINWDVVINDQVNKGVAGGDFVFNGFLYLEQ